MPFQCDRCDKLFRDNYGLNRHSLRGIKCISKNNTQEKKIDSSGVTIVNVYNIHHATTGNLNCFKNEDLSHIDVEEIIELWRKINKVSTDPYIRAGLLITGLHELINKNQNFFLRNI